MSAEAIGAEVLRVMQFLTPRKLSALTDYEPSEAKVSLSGMFVGSDTADEKHRLEKAKILPIGIDKKEDEIIEEDISTQVQSEKVMPVEAKEHEQKNASAKKRKKQKYNFDFQDEDKVVAIEAEMAKIEEELERREREGTIKTIKGAREEQELKEKLLQLEDMKQPSASVFILQEKEKAKSNQRSLKRMEIYGLYSKIINSNLQTNDTIPLENKGILVNKKQE